MKISTIFSTISLALAGGAIAAPAVSDSNALAERAPIDSAYSIVSGLSTEIKTYTGSINATSASLSKSSTQEEKDAAAASVGKQIEGITSAVKAATVKVKALSSASKSEASKRQAAPGPAQLAALLEEILLDISGALNNIIADLGLEPLLSFLTPLVASLSALLLSLEVVVNNILALVQALVDGLLTGLSIGLAGIVL